MMTPESPISSTGRSGCTSSWTAILRNEVTGELELIPLLSGEPRAHRSSLRARHGRPTKNRRCRAKRRLGARLSGASRTVGNPGRGGADSGEAVFVCIASTWRKLPLLPRFALASAGVVAALGAYGRASTGKRIGARRIASGIWNWPAMRRDYLGPGSARSGLSDAETAVSPCSWWVHWPED
jgi:hypothetical protein